MFAGRCLGFVGTLIRSGWVLVLLGCNPPLTTPEPTIPVTNHVPVLHSLQIQPAQGVAPLEISFLWRASDPDQDLLSCEVDFEGDGSFELSLNTCVSVARAHTYSAAGEYTFRLRLHDSRGGELLETRQVRVEANAAPVISSFTATPASGQAALPVGFGWAVSDANADGLTCFLDTDNDGRFEYTIEDCASGFRRNHTYGLAGTYQAKLRVEDSRGGFAEALLGQPVQVLPDVFDIELRINGSLSESVRAAFEAAKARWSEVIVEGLPYVAEFNLSSGNCISKFPAYRGPVDDVLIDVRVAPIDGPGGVRGQAGACWVHSDVQLTLYGVMEFDSEDLLEVEAAGLLGRLVLHEMGHVLGYGTLWNFGRKLVENAPTDGTCGGKPVFVGANAVREWQALGGSGLVPLENAGGPETCNRHWSEWLVDNELMTGYLNPGFNPLSRLTIASMQDLGYRVNYAAAEEFILPNRVGLMGQRLPAGFAMGQIKPQGIWPKR